MKEKEKNKKSILVNSSDAIMDTVSKDVSDRLATIKGHVEAVIKMLDDKRSCEDVLIQLAAVESSMNKVKKKIFMDHVGHCIKNAVQSGDLTKLDDLVVLIDRYMK